LSIFVIAAASSSLLPVHIISFATTSTSLAPDLSSKSSTGRDRGDRDCMFKQPQEFLELSGYKRAREDLSYAVINYILFSDSGFTSFEPGTISIPANITVIWFNNDDAEHSLTAIRAIVLYTFRSSV
jgi:hypothetical protein